MTTDRPIAGDRWSPTWRIAALGGALIAVNLGVLIWQAPNQTFDRFLAMDSGGELAIQDLIRRGYQPGVDFGYPYGLLAPLIGRVWYGLAGLTPRSYTIFVALASWCSCWGLARLAVARGVGWTGLVLIALAIPDLLFVTYLTSVQTIEQAFLIHALAEQARGRRGSALALLTACCFVKPALAFVQGLAVLILALVATRRAGRGAAVRLLAPALVVGGVLAVVLAVAFGPPALAATLSPARGASIYRANHYGFFFGQGRAFWILPGAGVRDYFRYEVGFWLVGTLVLAGGLAASLVRLVRRGAGSSASGNDELIVVCGAVHLAFVCFLFGHRWTWVYSLPLLVVGLALLSEQGPRGRAVGLALAALLLVNDRSKLTTAGQERRTLAPSAATLGLWASAEEQAEWSRVRDLIRGERPVLLAMCEGGALLVPEFAPPVAGYLVPGNMLPAEVARKARQLAEATWIVSSHAPEPPDFEAWKQLSAGFKGTEPIFRGRFFQVHRRVVQPTAIEPDQKPRAP